MAETRLQRERRLKARKSPIAGRQHVTQLQPEPFQRSGKRKRGTSPLRVPPKQNARAIPFDIITKTGDVVAFDVKTIQYNRKG